MVQYTSKSIPLVIVEGFLGRADASLWGGFKEHLNKDTDIPRDVIFVSVGPVSSLHDRACELFYALKGGTVDYGEKHARANGHARYGRIHAEGLYSGWSRESPLHFLGHSIGGPTIMKLQWLISTGFFGGLYHPDMLLSVTTVSAPFRGTQVVYLLGERTDTAPAVRWLSLGDLLAKGIHIGSYLAPLLPKILDFHTESRSLSFQKSSFISFLQQLWRSDWAEGRDAAPFDVTFLASDEREANEEGAINPGTFYRSYAANMTVKTSEESNIHKPSAGHALYAPGLYATSYAMGSFDFSDLKPSPTFIHDVDRNPSYHANDGVVPVFSQWHPLDCESTHCRHLDIAPEEDTIERGTWHVYDLDDANHLSIAPFWFNTSRQTMFWREMGQWLWKVDVAQCI
ncbi:unnamed protein product [Somion occarium]|uniref:Lipase-like C-terminal domain-containing protein n=1 Tax=Somion occarium TaxID=3059160 RepID=A0ABP1CER7_9APHY